MLDNLDTYAKIAMALRVAAVPSLLWVLHRQYKQIKDPQDPDLKGLKYLLFVCVVLILGGNLFSIMLNFFRQNDGNLMQDARHIGMVFNGVAILSTGVVLSLIYDYKGGNKK